MSVIKIIGYIAAGILIFFGVLFIWGAFSDQGTPGWIVTGIVIVIIGFGLIWFASRIKPATPVQNNVTLNIDLPANVELDSFKCQSCGGALTVDNIKMVAGAPVVTCPYCGSVYQLKEEPKW
jgi:DNA-directed RNA polymerase subunit RPC12/RpoP